MPPKVCGMFPVPSAVSQNCVRTCAPKRQRAGAVQDAGAPSDTSENAKRKECVQLAGAFGPLPMALAIL